ncbi:hypothetical protein SLE2022_111780 [Rubroshorea leprosula]
MLPPRFLFPPSLLVAAASVVSLTSMANIALLEIRGRPFQYSKFSEVGSGSHNQNAATRKKIVLPGRTGMLVAYTPAFLTGAASFALFPDEGLRFLLLKSAITIHFLKRILEVIFIHKYSGGMPVDSMIVISLSYFITTAIMIYAQNLTQGLPDPPIDLQYPGIILFLIGISGNFYHHFLLSRLRRNTMKEYKIPRGGLFEMVICPHYLFEILTFWGIALISQTLFSFCSGIGTTWYLMGRSYGTRKWYLSKFEDFPNHVKAIIPFIF